MPGPRFTIALPVRNGGTYLKLAVESILAQSCGDFNLAILDNASTDGTPDYLATLRDERVCLYPAKRPLSIEENWARIKELPKNEYLTTIGHDDLLDPNFLEVITSLIRDHPSAGLYYTHFRIIDEAGEFSRHCRPMPARETAPEFLAARLSELRDSFGTGHVLRSATYDDIGGIPPFPKLLYADDALFVQAIGTSYRATALEETFSYRWHASSASTGCAMRELFGGLEQYAQLLRRLCIQNPSFAPVLERYFPTRAFYLGRLWRNEELLSAYRAGTPLEQTVDERSQALVDLFGGNPQGQNSLIPMEYRLLEYGTRSRAGRGLYASFCLQKKLRAAAKQILRGLFSRRAAGRLCR